MEKSVLDMTIFDFEYFSLNQLEAMQTRCKDCDTVDLRWMIDPGNSAFVLCEQNGESHVCHHD